MENDFHFDLMAGSTVTVVTDVLYTESSDVLYCSRKHGALTPAFLIGHPTPRDFARSSALISGSRNSFIPPPSSKEKYIYLEAISCNQSPPICSWRTFFSLMIFDTFSISSAAQYTNFVEEEADGRLIWKICSLKWKWLHLLLCCYFLPSREAACS